MAKELTLEELTIAHKIACDTAEAMAAADKGVALRLEVLAMLFATEVSSLPDNMHPVERAKLAVSMLEFISKRAREIFVVMAEHEAEKRKGTPAI